MRTDISKCAENYLYYEKDGDGFYYFHRLLESQKSAYELNAMYRQGYAASTGVFLHFQTTGDKVVCNCKVSSNKGGIIAFFTQPVTHYQLIGKAKKRKPPKSAGNRIADKDENAGFEVWINEKQYGVYIAQKGKVEINLDNPEHRWMDVRIYLPQHTEVGLASLFSNGVIMEGQEIEKSRQNEDTRPRKILALGDSITSGCRSQCATGSYVLQLAEKLHCQVVNQGVPGYTFQAQSLNGLEKIPFQPALITIAYGTNDWNYAPDRAMVNQNIQEYFKKMNTLFPKVPKVVITPIWRVDEKEVSYYGTIEELRKSITEQAERMQKTLVLQGDSLIPHEIKYLRDGHIHPNEEGHRLYADNLAKVIQETWSVL